MEVLSNKEIYVLLKLLKEKNNVKLDKNFTQKELEHLQSEICNAENKTPAEVLTIEKTYKNMMGMSLHDGYKLSALNIDSIEEYSNAYIEMLLDEKLDGYTPENNIQQLLAEFYSTTKDCTDYENYTVNEIKYMPVILFAYVNNLVKLKTITNKKYDLRRDLYQDRFEENLAFNEAMDNLLDVIATMDAFAFMGDFNDYFNSCTPDRQANIKNMRGFIKNVISIQSAKNVKNTTSTNSSKKLYHLSDQQWKIWFCIDLYVKKSNIKQTDFTIIMDSRIFEICKVSEDYKKPSDKVISIFNKTIWDIVKSPKEEKSRLIVPQKNDLYTINLQVYRSFCNQINNIVELQNDMILNKDVQRQVVLFLRDFQEFTSGKSV